MYVITWSYHDKSSFGVVAVRNSEEEAETLKTFLEAHAGSGKEYAVHHVETEKV